MDYVKTNLDHILEAARNIPFCIFKWEDVHGEWIAALRSACRDNDLERTGQLLENANKMSDKYLDEGGDTNAYIRASSALGIMERTYWHVMDYAEKEAYAALMRLVDRHCTDTKASIQIFSIGSQVLKKKFREASLRIETRARKGRHEDARDDELLKRALDMLALIRHAGT